jgi:hypothetical protein
MMVVSTMPMLAPSFDGYSYEQYWPANVSVVAAAPITVKFCNAANDWEFGPDDAYK